MSAACLRYCARSAARQLWLSYRSGRVAAPLMHARLCSGPLAHATARAERYALQALQWHARGKFCTLSAIFSFIGASPAFGQVGIAASIFSDDRLRGYSLSDDRPVAIVDLTYDAPNGIYGAASGTLVATRHNGIQPLAVEVDAGYAKRLNAGLTLDVGATHSNYSHYSSGRIGSSYSQAYIGLGGKLLSARLSLSPDYLQSHNWSAYGELNASLIIASKLRLNGHVGLTVPLASDGYDQGYRREIDWRIGAARDIGRWTLSLAWTGVGRGADMAPQSVRSHQALIAGLAFAL